MLPSTKNFILCDRPIQKCLHMIEDFHGWVAPGLVLGLFMVDLARECMGDRVEFDAIVETRHCLPDAIQLFTPCSTGNGWMKILNWDKFALSLYDRKNRHGCRVWLDLEKAKQFTDLYNWFMRQVPKDALPLEILIDTILSAQRAVLSYESVYITRLHERDKKGRTAVCPACKEAYAEKLGKVCISCQGKGYYTTSRGHVKERSEQ